MNNDLSAINNFFGENVFGVNNPLIKGMAEANENPMGTFGGNDLDIKGMYELPQRLSDFRYDGVRRKTFGLGFEILRKIAEKVIIIGIIHNIRVQQVEPFTKAPSISEEDVGFHIRLRDKGETPTEKQKSVMRKTEDWVMECGEEKGSSDRDDFFQFSKKLIRDNLTIDQIGTALGRTRGGDVREFRILDGATIYPVMKDIGYKGIKKIDYVQIYEENVYEVFTSDDLIFSISNPRTDLKYTNFGYSFMEMAITTITGFLNAHQYNNDFFSSSTQPPGFISFDTAEGWDENTFKALQREWENQFRGLPELWKTGFLGGKAKWNTIRPNNKDLEFNQYIQMLSGWLFALYGMDSAEAGLRLQQAQNVMNENVENKIAYSQSRGLKHHLSFMERIVNKILRFNEDLNDYVFEFTGLEKKDQKAELEVEKMQTETYLTINEMRERKDLEPIENGDIISNSFFMQAVQSSQQEQEGGMEGEGEEGADEGGDDGFNFDEYEDENADAENEKPEPENDDAFQPDEEPVIEKSINFNIDNLLK